MSNVTHNFPGKAEHFMILSRRGFLSAFGATAVLDPERLLWRPGAKHISIPKPTWVGLDWSNTVSYTQLIWVSSEGRVFSLDRIHGLRDMSYTIAFLQGKASIVEWRGQ